VVSTASAGSLSLSFKDCGAKHAVTKDVQPTTLELGADTAITGTGSLDKEVSGGTYDMELKAGGGLIDSHFTGNNCEAKDFTLPLGLGTLSWDGISCPLAAADSVAINFHTKLAASLPAALATSDIHLAANDQDGESVLCVDLHLAKQESAELGCKGTADPAGPACYEGSAGALGLTETVKAQLLEVGAGDGKLEFTGSGIEGFTCSEKTYTKSGSDVTLSDLSDCLPDHVEVTKVQYCSDDDTMKVTVKDDQVPLPVTATLKNVPCAGRDVFASCKGDADPVITEATCWTGSAGALGLTETVTVKVNDFGNGAGHVDFSGDGIESFSCSGKTFTKSGQDITFSDSSDCLPSGIVVSGVKYCSDSDTMKITVKDTTVPLPISAIMSKVACPSSIEV
jgi:hypothetical protein